MDLSPIQEPRLLPGARIAVIVVGLCASPASLRAMDPVPWRPSVIVEALVPAEIELPPKIQTILVVNRHRPKSVGAKLVKNIEGIFSHEWAGQDKKGAKAAVSAAATALDESPRFGVVNSDIALPGSGTEFLPVPLPAYEVRRLCKEHGADALVAIEAFDSGHDTDRVERKSGLLGLQTREVFELKVGVKFGWRLYGASTGYLLDEFEGEDSASFEKGDKDDLPDTTDLVKQFGAKAGRTYAQRIAPIRVPILLSYHSKGSPSIKAGKKLAKKKDWVGAEQVWRKELDNPDPDVRGRAAHNIAVAREVLGDPEDALVWVTLASHEYGNKVAWEYYEELSVRVENLRRARNQLAAGVPPNKETQE